MNEEKTQQSEHNWQFHTINLIRIIYIVSILPLLAYAVVGAFVIVWYGNEIPQGIVALILPFITIWTIWWSRRPRNRGNYRAAVIALLVPFLLFMGNIIMWLSTWAF